MDEEDDEAWLQQIRDAMEAARGALKLGRAVEAAEHQRKAREIAEQHFGSPLPVEAMRHLARLLRVS